MSSEIWGWGEVRWQQGMEGGKGNLNNFDITLQCLERLRLLMGGSGAWFGCWIWSPLVCFCYFSFDSKCWELIIILWGGKKHLSCLWRSYWRYLNRHFALHTCQQTGITSYSPVVRWELSLWISITYSQLLQSPVVVNFSAFAKC